jgi:hypothetical protein
MAFDRYGVLDLGRHYQVHLLRDGSVAENPNKIGFRRAFVAEFSLPHEPNRDIDAVCAKLSVLLTLKPANSKQI